MKRGQINLQLEICLETGERTSIWTGSKTKVATHIGRYVWGTGFPCGLLKILVGRGIPLCLPQLQLFFQGQIHPRKHLLDPAHFWVRSRTFTLKFRCSYPLACANGCVAIGNLWHSCQDHIHFTHGLGSPLHQSDKLSWQQGTGEIRLGAWRGRRCSLWCCGLEVGGGGNTISIW